MGVSLEWLYRVDLGVKGWKEGYGWLVVWCILGSWDPFCSLLPLSLGGCICPALRRAWKKKSSRSKASQKVNTRD